MPGAFDLLIRGGSCVTPSGIGEADVGVIGGRIAAIGALDPRRAAEVFDARGLHVLPGVIDSHVHFREPGGEHKEDLATGSAAAVLGGVTAVFDMPNTSPSVTGVADLARKCRAAKGRVWCDIAFFVGATADNVEELARLEQEPACAGVKLFMGSSTGSLLVEDDATLAAVLGNGSRRLMVHAEDEARLRARKGMLSAEPASHADWRDAETAAQAVRRLLAFARGQGRRVHVAHASTADEMTLLAQARDIATVEVTPHHLTLTAPDAYRRLGTRAVVNPPVRDAAHVAALWEAVRSGLVDTLGSDHAPHTIEEKAKGFPGAPSGMPGVQTLVPLMLDHVNAGRLSLQRFVDLASAGPARVFGIAGKGRIAQGYDADFTIVDLAASRTIADHWIASRCGWTPYAGMTVKGWPVATVIRGRVVARDGALAGDPAGEALSFLEVPGHRR